MINAPIIAHFSHRVLALVVALAVLALAARVLRSDVPPSVRRWATLAAVLVLVQVALGVASVLTVLAVAPVSLHTVVAAGLLSSLVYLATISSPARNRPSPASAATAA